MAFPRLLALVSALYLLVCLMLPVAAHAAPSADAAATALSPCFVRVAPGDDARTIAAAPDRWICPDRQSDLGPGDYWAVARVPGRVDGQPRVLRWSSTWQDRVELTLIRADGSQQQDAVASADGAERLEPGAIYEIPMAEQDSDVVTVVGKFHGTSNVRAIWQNPVVTTAQDAQRSNLIAAGLFGGFIGLCIALFAYNAVIWVALRHRYQILYCGMVLSTLLYALSTSGVLGYMFGGLANNDRLRISYLGLAMIATCAMGFARTFLDDIVFSRRFDRWLMAVAGALLGSALAFTVVPQSYLGAVDRAYFLSFALLIGTAATLFLRALQRGGTIGRLYVIVWTFPIVVNIGRLLHGFGVVSYSYYLDNSTLIAMTVEALLSSMIIAYRIRMVQRDRDHAIAQGHEARRLADTDSLTGLMNRRALLRHACPTEVSKDDWRLILIDIDHFKRVNDIAGHVTGDEVLVTVAGIISASLRPEAVAARIGGEEFAILFRSGPRDRRLYANLLARVRNAQLPGGMRVTVSMGVADGPLGPDEAMWRRLYREAVAALYAAKNSGRNRLIQASSLRALPAAA